MIRHAALRTALTPALAAFLLLTSAVAAPATETAPAAERAAPEPSAKTAPAVKISNLEMFERSLEVARSAVEQYGVYDDPRELARLNEVGYRVAAESGFTAYPLTFHLIDMPEPNAFALPGGHLFVTRGMIRLGLDDDMLAALLGHEIAHVALNHHAKMQRRATLMSVLGQALMVGVMIGASGDDGPRDPYNPMQNAAESRQRSDMIQGAAAASLIVSELLLRSFSREHEDQADEEGQRWAAAAGFDPDGANRLFALMQARIPQTRKYGYWSTHPFFDERVRSGDVRAELLKQVEDPEPADGFRRATQETLLGWMDAVEVASEDQYHDQPGRTSRRTVRFVEDEALAAWPRGPAAEGIRLAELHRLRERELAQPALERDYGKLVRAYEEQERQVARLTPGSDFLSRLEEERESLVGQAADLYPRARQVLADDVFEIPFLERYLSNWPDSPEVPRVALLLGDAHSRLGRPAEAVRHYLRAVETAPGSDEAERANRGLRVLAGRLDQLTALQRLALQRRDEDLGRLAEERLAERVTDFDDVDNGAGYLDNYPDGPHAEAVTARMNVLADKLYAEVVLYQAIGDHGKAVERINKILTYAPLSNAADLLRDRAVLEAA